jgi:hypothetical protein
MPHRVVPIERGEIRRDDRGEFRTRTLRMAQRARIRVMRRPFAVYARAEKACGVEVDQRARDTRLGLERSKRLLVRAGPMIAAQAKPSPTTAQHSLPGGALPPYLDRSLIGRNASASPDAPELKFRIQFSPAGSLQTFGSSATEPNGRRSPGTPPMVVAAPSSLANPADWAIEPVNCRAVWVLS